MKGVFYLRTTKGIYKVHGSIDDVITLLKISGDGEVQIL